MMMVLKNNYTYATTILTIALSAITILTIALSAITILTIALSAITSHSTLFLLYEKNINKTTDHAYYN